MQQIATFGIVTDGKIQGLGGKLQARVFGIWERLQQALPAPIDGARGSEKQGTKGYYGGATRVLANALALKAAYADLPPNQAEAASRWKQFVDATRADFEARKTDRSREVALTKDTVLIALSIL